MNWATGPTSPGNRRPPTSAYRGDQLTVTAVFDLDQTDFGMTPLSLLGGALQVANRTRVRLRIVAEKG